MKVLTAAAPAFYARQGPDCRVCQSCLADCSALGFRQVQSLVPCSESVKKSSRDETQL
jgi:hypothetical protein